MARLARKVDVLALDPDGLMDVDASGNHQRYGEESCRLVGPFLITRSPAHHSMRSDAEYAAEDDGQELRVRSSVT